MIDAGVKVCPECLRPFEKVAQWDGLTVMNFPPRAYWRGIIVPGMTPMRVRLLMSMAETGAATRMRLLMHLGEDTDDKTLDAHISQMNRAFRLAQVPVRIRAENGLRKLVRIEE